jgi:hypothetical protein
MINNKNSLDPSFKYPSDIYLSFFIKQKIRKHLKDSLIRICHFFLRLLLKSNSIRFFTRMHLFPQKLSERFLAFLRINRLNLMRRNYT